MKLPASFSSCLLGSCAFIHALCVPVAHAETFQEALVSAYSHPLLLAERARLREIDEGYIQARAGGRLTSSISGRVGIDYSRATSFNFLSGLDLETDVTTVPRTLQLEVIQPLYQGGRIRALKDQASANILAARESLRQTEQLVFEQTATAYADVLRSERQSQMQRSNVRVLSRQLTAAKDRFDAGDGTLTDIAQADSRLAGADIGLAQADAELAAARAAYEQLTGHPPEDLQSAPVIILPASLSEALDLALKNSPSIIASQFNEQAADAGLEAAKSNGRPFVGLVGTVTGAADPTFGVSRSNSATLAANLSIPIFSGGLNRSGKRAASEAKSRTLFETRNVKRQVQQAVTQIWAQLDAAQRTRLASQKQVDSAQVALDGVILEQSVGTRTTLDVLDAEQELLAARLTVEEARRNYNVASYSLLRTIGVFDADGLSLPIETYDESRNLLRISQTPGLLQDPVNRDEIRERNTPDFILSGESLYDQYIVEPLEKLED